MLEGELSSLCQPKVTFFLFIYSNFSEWECWNREICVHRFWLPNPMSCGNPGNCLAAPRFFLYLKSVSL